MSKYKFQVVAKATGGVLSYHETEADARNRIDLYETIDRRDGNYSPDAYRIDPVK